MHNAKLYKTLSSTVHYTRIYRVLATERDSYNHTVFCSAADRRDNDGLIFLVKYMTMILHQKKATISRATREYTVCAESV